VGATYNKYTPVQLSVNGAGRATMSVRNNANTLIQKFSQKIKMPFLKKKEFWVFSSIYFFISFIELTIKLRAAYSTWFDGRLAENHNLLWNFQYYNNEQSRLLQWVIPQAIVKITHISIPHAYMVQRFAFVFLAFLCFHYYMRKWLSPGDSFAGVAFLAAVMPLTYGGDLQESAPLLMLLFVLGLWTIREYKILLFELVLIIGSITNETILILTAVYFFYLFQWVHPKKINSRNVVEFFTLVGRTILIALLPFAITISVRYITRDRPHLGGDILLWSSNWQQVWNALINTHIFDVFESDYLFFILLFSVFWLYALLGYRTSGLFLQRAFWMVPLFLLAHFITGKINESRQMIPLGFILIPMGLSFVLSKAFEKSEVDLES
jgi:hypothetical protein